MIVALFMMLPPGFVERFFELDSEPRNRIAARAHTRAGIKETKYLTNSRCGRPGRRDKMFSDLYVVSFGVLGALALITPALFSRPPSRPDGRRGRKTSQNGLLEPSLSRQGGGEAGRERVGRVRARPEGAPTTAPISSGFRSARDAVTRERRRARGRPAVVGRLLEGVGQGDQPRLGEGRAGEGHSEGERVLDRRGERHESAGHGDAR